MARWILNIRSGFQFARGMAQMMAMPAQLMAKLVDPAADRKLRILDVAAGHGLFGIPFATQNPQVEVTALDWTAVLEVAKENAQKTGVADRYKTIGGSAFDVDFGSGYDLVLLTELPASLRSADLRNVAAESARRARGRRTRSDVGVCSERRSCEPAGVSRIQHADAGRHAVWRCVHVSLSWNACAATQDSHGSTLHPLPPTFQQVVISEK
jgi:hypothetical protein